MRMIKQGILLCFITFAFWGVLYPQFSLAEETYTYVESEEETSLTGGNSQNAKGENLRKKESGSGEQRKKNPKEDFIAILNADTGELLFRSRLWELWKERAEKRNEQNGAEDSLWKESV